MLQLLVNKLTYVTQIHLPNVRTWITYKCDETSWLLHHDGGATAPCHLLPAPLHHHQGQVKAEVPGALQRWREVHSYNKLHGEVVSLTLLYDTDNTMVMFQCEGDHNRVDQLQLWNNDLHHWRQPRPLAWHQHPPALELYSCLIVLLEQERVNFLKL